MMEAKFTISENGVKQEGSLRFIGEIHSEVAEGHLFEVIETDETVSEIFLPGITLEWKEVNEHIEAFIRKHTDAGRNVWFSIRKFVRFCMEVHASKETFDNYGPFSAHVWEGYYLQDARKLRRVAFLNRPRQAAA